MRGERLSEGLVYAGVVTGAAHFKNELASVPERPVDTGQQKGMLVFRNPVKHSVGKNDVHRLLKREKRGVSLVETDTRTIFVGYGQQFIGLIDALHVVSAVLKFFRESPVATAKIEHTRALSSVNKTDQLSAVFRHIGKVGAVFFGVPGCIHASAPENRGTQPETAPHRISRNTPEPVRTAPPQMPAEENYRM